MFREVTKTTHYPGSSSGGGGTWGSITGTLSSQMDLQTALDAKQDLLWVVATSTAGTQQNDFAPTNWATCSVLRMAPTASLVVTGFSATGVSDGEEKVVINDSTSRLIVLADQNASSSAANRLNLSRGVRRGHYVILPGDAVLLQYDTTAARWKVVAEVATFGGFPTRRFMVAQAGANTQTSVGFPVTTESVATATAVASTTYITSVARNRYQTTTVAGNSSGVRVTDAFVIRGAAAGNGGWAHRQRFGGHTNPANAGSFYIGFRASTAAIGDVDASALVNIIGIGTDATQSTLRRLVNDAAGAATAVDLGANFPWNDTAAFEHGTFCSPNASDVAGYIFRTDDLTITPLVWDDSADIPANTTALSWHLHVGNRAAGVAYALSFMGLDVYTPN